MNGRKSELSNFRTRFGELYLAWSSSERQAFGRFVIDRKPRLFPLKEDQNGALAIHPKPGGRNLLALLGVYYDEARLVDRGARPADGFSKAELAASFGAIKPSKMYDYHSDLYELAKDFIAFEVARANPAISSRLLLIAARDHPSDKFFADSLKRGEHSFGSLTESLDLWHGENYYRHIEQIRNEVMTRRHQARPNFDEGYRLIELQALHQFLRLRVVHQNGANILNSIGGPGDLPDWIQILITKHSQTPLISLYVRLGEYVSKDPKGFTLDEHEDRLGQIQRAFLGSIGQLTADERYEIFGVVSNAYTFLISYGIEPFLAPLAQWYQVGREIGVFLGENSFTVYGLKNYIVIACRSGRIEVARGLVEEFRRRLEKDHPHYLAYLSALIAYYEGDGRVARRRLAVIARYPGVLDPYLEEAVITLRIKLYVEAGELVAAQDEIDRLRRRKDTSVLDGKIYDRALNRLRYVERYVALGLEDREGRRALVQELEAYLADPLRAEGAVDEVGWLVEVVK